MTILPQTVFAQRAAFYTTSAVHRDRVVLDRLVQLARVQPANRVLDVATGAGHTAFAFAPHVREVIATDITPEMLFEGGRLRLAAHRSHGADMGKAEGGIGNVHFQLADAHDLPFDDESFDVMTCRRAAHHFADIRRALREMCRVLHPGGRLVIDDRSVPEDDFVDATLNRLDVLHDHSHIREYRPSEWQSMLHEAGCLIEVVEPYTKQRPLSAFTHGVEPESVAEIGRIVAALNEAQRSALSVTEKDGEIYLNHWYVMVVGVKNDE
jgi:ubiquinone/menaquinone biosynthesis C-methylase UbiE